MWDSEKYHDCDCDIEVEERCGWRCLSRCSWFDLMRSTILLSRGSEIRCSRTEIEGGKRSKIDSRRRRVDGVCEKMRQAGDMKSRQ